MVYSVSLQVVAPNQYSYGHGAGKGSSVGSRRVKIALGFVICCVAAVTIGHLVRGASRGGMETAMVESEVTTVKVND